MSKPPWQGEQHHRCVCLLLSYQERICLQGVNFAVFGLGNRQYEHFCAVGKHLHKALLTLGATSVGPRGDGDDDEDIEADFDKWRTELYEALDKSSLLSKSQVRKASPCQLAATLVPKCAPKVLLQACQYQAGACVQMAPRSSSVSCEGSLQKWSCKRSSYLGLWAYICAVVLGICAQEECSTLFPTRAATANLSCIV